MWPFLSSRRASETGQGELELRLLEDHETNAGDHFLTAKATGSRSQKSEYLDGVRGLAALTVFFVHNFQFLGPNGSPDRGFGETDDTGYTFWQYCSFPFIRIFYTGGHPAVVIFFVLSGFVLSIGPLAKLKRNDTPAACRRSLISAIVRRPVRLYAPPIIISFLVALLIHTPGPLLEAGSNVPQANLWQESMHFISTTAAYLNPFQHHNIYMKYAYNPPVWTLPIELKGSMLVYGLMLISTFIGDIRIPYRLPFATTALAILAFLMLQLNISWSMAAFTFGMLLATIDTLSLDRIPTVHHLLATGTHHLSFVFGWWLLSSPLSSIDGLKSTPGWHWLGAVIPRAYHNYTFHRYWEVVGATLFIYSVMRIAWLKSFFASRPLQYLGKISFMLYLVHMIIIRAVTARAYRAFGGWVAEFGEGTALNDKLYIPDWGVHGFSLRYGVALGLGLPLSIGLAHLATVWVDGPCLVLAEKWANFCRLGREKGGGKENAVLPT